jgi:hypothetical protein
LTEANVIERHEQDHHDEPRTKVTLIHDHCSFGVLKVESDGITIKIRLLARHVKVLIALESAMRADEDLDDEFRGLRSNEQLADAYAHTQGDQLAYDPLAYTPGPQAMAAYRAQIHKSLREASPPGSPAVRLTETVRGAGVRLVHRIEIIDLSTRHT